MKIAIYAIILIATLFLSLFIPTKGPYLMTMLSTEELVRRADRIVIGEVVSTECQWDEAHRLIYTLATLKVEKDLKNATPPLHLTIRYLGGTVDNITLIASGVCTLSKSEKVLLYLKKDDANTLRILGNTLGKYQIIYDPEPDTKFIEADFVGFAKSDKEESPQKRVRLDDYLAEVRSILQKLKGSE